MIITLSFGHTQWSWRFELAAGQALGSTSCSACFVIVRSNRSASSDELASKVTSSLRMFAKDPRLLRDESSRERRSFRTRSIALPFLILRSIFSTISAGGDTALMPSAIIRQVSCVFVSEARSSLSSPTSATTACEEESRLVLTAIHSAPTATRLLTTRSELSITVMSNITVKF